MTTTQRAKAARTRYPRAHYSGGFSVDLLLRSRIVVDRGFLTDDQRAELNRRAEVGQLHKGVQPDGCTYWMVT